MPAANKPVRTAPRTVPGAVIEDDTPKVRPVRDGERSPARPRQVTRAKLTAAAAAVTAFLAWRYAGGHHPGRTFEAHAIWFVVWEVILTVAILFVWTGFSDRDWKTRGAARYDVARDAGYQAKARYAARRGPREDPPGDGGEADDGDLLDARPGARPGGGRPPRPVRGASVARRGPGTAPAGPAWKRVCALIAELDTSSGHEIIERLQQSVTGTRKYGPAFSELADRLVTDLGWDPKGVTQLAEGGPVAEACAALSVAIDSAIRQIVDHHEELITYADDGKQAPNDPDTWKE